MTKLQSISNVNDDSHHLACVKKINNTYLSIVWFLYVERNWKICKGEFESELYAAKQ